MSFINELKRRNVFRVGIAYVIAAWLIIQIADVMIDNIGAPDWLFSSVLLVLAIGFPVGLIFAWAFEMTPEGIKKESEVDRSRSIAPQTGRGLDRVIIGVLLLALAWFAWDKFSSSPRESSVAGNDSVATESLSALNSNQDATNAEAVERSIAVLPLANRSTNPEDAFFAEGIHDELLTQLSRVSSLKVISRTSVMGYAGTTKRMPEIGEELGVSTLLEGGVQRAGDRVRINVQLIEAATDEHLWAEVYDRELSTENLFDIQSDITQSIAAALKTVLTGEEQQNLARKPTDNVEAYAYYLKGKSLALSYGREPEQIDESIAAYQKAIELDPGFAEAYAALSVDWSERNWTATVRKDEAGNALTALEKARQLAPELASTYTAEGYYHYWCNLDYAPAIQAFERSLAIQPGDQITLRGKSYVLRRSDRADEAIQVMKELIEVNPLDASLPADLAYSYIRQGNIPGATEMSRRATALGGHTFWRGYVNAELAMVTNDPRGAQAALGRITTEMPPFAASLGNLVARVLNETAPLERFLKLSEGERWQADNVLFEKGLILQYLGREDAYQQNLIDLETLIENQQPGNSFRGDDYRSRMLLAALNGDRESTLEWAEQYFTRSSADALSITEDTIVPQAFLMVGADEELFERLETLVSEKGPWEMYFYATDPIFARYSDHPRFKALVDEYMNWVAGL